MWVGFIKKQHLEQKQKLAVLLVWICSINQESYFYECNRWCTDETVAITHT